MLALAKEYYTIPHDVDRLPVRESLSRNYPEFLELSNQFCEEDDDFKERFELIRRLHGRKHLECNIDGGVRYAQPHLPAAAASSYVIYSKGEIIQKDVFTIPPYISEEGTYHLEPQPNSTIVSSHITEYEALNTCLRVLINTRMDVFRIRITLRTDSEVLYNQLKGVSRNRTEHLSRLMQESRYLMSQFESVDLIKIPREKNEYANQLVQDSLNAENF